MIIEEINMYLDNPQRYLPDLWDELLYGNQPAGWSVLGEREAIQHLNRRDFVNYFKNHYSAQNTVVVVAGNIDKGSRLKIGKYFNRVNTQKPKTKIKAIERQKKPGLLVYYKKTDQTHLRLGVRGYNILNPDRYVLDVLGVILGGNMSSRLWIDVRERHGLAYYVRTGTENHTDTGWLCTGAGVDNHKTDQAIQIIIKNYKLIKDKKIDNKELRKAKDFMKGKAILAMEESDEQAGFYAFQELLENKILTLDEIFAKIEAVTADDIQRVARDIFKPEKLNLALIGPFKDKSKFEKLLKL